MVTAKRLCTQYGLKGTVGVCSDMMIEARYREFFGGKRITVMGLGLLGRGVGDAAFLAECGAEVIVTDLKSEIKLQESFNRLKGFSNVRFTFGEHKVEDFENRDMILVAAGVPMDSPYLAHAQKNNVPLCMSGALFAQLSGIKIIGVTGTRGKSTVTHMIHHVLKTATHTPVVLGGNIRGVSNLQLLNEVTKESVAVMELDSWQLQGFGWAEISPSIAVFTNFMFDHLNYYKNDLDAYFADKAHIFAHQKKGDVLIVAPEVYDRVLSHSKEGFVQEVIVASASGLPSELILQVKGMHNRNNAALACRALEACGLATEDIMEALATFEGIPGRLQLLRTHNGVQIYNDNNATTPEATSAALRALGTDAKNIVLILGGADKNIDMQELINVIPLYCKDVVLLPGSGSDSIEGKIAAHKTASIAEAVDTAFGLAKEGDIILFSPAFASFGEFVNEYDRNDQFVKLVESI